MSVGLRGPIHQLLGGPGSAAVLYIVYGTHLPSHFYRHHFIPRTQSQVTAIKLLRTPLSPQLSHATLKVIYHYSYGIFDPGFCNSTRRRGVLLKVLTVDGRILIVSISILKTTRVPSVRCATVGAQYCKNTITKWIKKCTE